MIETKSLKLLKLNRHLNYLEDFFYYKLPSKLDINQICMYESTRMMLQSATKIRSGRTGI
jgi:hypothetical protein